MIDQFSNGTRSVLKNNIQQILEKCGILKGGVSLESMSRIEEVFKWKGENVRARERTLGFCVFDARLNLRRLPPYREKNDDYKYFCDIVMFNGHAYGFKTGNSNRPADRRRQSLSYFEACIAVATGQGKQGARKKEHSEMYKQAYELFRETQHMQPDMDGYPRIHQQ